MIVGGGTAGWLAANVLQQRLLAKLESGSGSRATITLVEASGLGVGVGESTIPTLRDTLRSIGIPEDRFLSFCNATFKLGIRFDHWASPLSGSYWHPFERPVMDGVDLTQRWLASGQKDGLAEYATVVPQIACLGLTPKNARYPHYSGRFRYAYHVDAAQLATLLRQWATARGVRHVVGTVTSVNMTQTGDVYSVALQDGRTVVGDFFVDCSGFRRVVIGDALGEPFISFSEYLPCDEAIATVADSGDRISSFTRATAQRSGWIWDIPLSTRRGVGYVYSTSFSSRGQAEAVLARFLGRDLRDVRAIPMRIGRTKNLWVRNCLALGLAAGFLEPLEATGIYLTEAGLQLFCESISGDWNSAYRRQRYNSLMAKLFEEVRDFIVLHYAMSPRRDSPFWRYCTEEARYPDALETKLEAWRHDVPDALDFVGCLSPFQESSYRYVLGGLGFWSAESMAFVGAVLKEDERIRRLNRDIEVAHAVLPEQRQYLGQLT